MRQEPQAQVDQNKDMEKEYQKRQKAHKELKDKHATLLQTMYSNDEKKGKGISETAERRYRVEGKVCSIASNTV